MNGMQAGSGAIGLAPNVSPPRPPTFSSVQSYLDDCTAVVVDIEGLLNTLTGFSLEETLSGAVQPVPNGNLDLTLDKVRTLGLRLERIRSELQRKV